MKRRKEEQQIRQALEAAFLAEQRQYEQGEMPPLSPDFKARMMAQYQSYCETSARRKARSRVAAVRHWAYAAAALVIVCVLGLSLPTMHTVAQRWMRAHADRPEVSYTISQMPADCTQVYHQTSAYMAYTQWETGDSDRIVLLQEKASPEALLDGKDYRQKKIYTEKINGTLYIGDDHTVLIWQNEQYYFLIMMDGALTDQDIVLQIAASLVMTRI